MLPCWLCNFVCFDKSDLALITNNNYVPATVGSSQTFSYVDSKDLYLGNASAEKQFGP